MDLSKIPKASDEPPAADAPIQPIPENRERPTAGSVAGDVWFNAIIGIVLMGLGFRFARFLFANLTHSPFQSGYQWSDGSPVPYFQVQNFVALTEMGLFFFGFVVLLEAGVIAAISLRRSTFSQTLILLALLLTLATTILNIYVCIRLLQNGTTPTLSGLAVAFGGWIIFNEFQMLRSR